MIDRESKACTHRDLLECHLLVRKGERCEGFGLLDLLSLFVLALPEKAKLRLPARHVLDAIRSLNLDQTKDFTPEPACPDPLNRPVLSKVDFLKLGISDLLLVLLPELSTERVEIALARDEERIVVAARDINDLVVVEVLAL